MEYEILALRAERRSLGEIAARLNIEVRDALAWLALLYDSLWLTHLPPQRRNAELERYFEALRSVETAPERRPALPGHERVTAPESAPRLAVLAVDEDERNLNANSEPVPAVTAPPAEQEPLPARSAPRVVDRELAIDERARFMPPSFLPAWLKLSRTLVLFGVLVLLIVASAAIIALGKTDSLPAAAASNTPTLESQVSGIGAPSETPLLPVVATDMDPTATATATPFPTATPTLMPEPTATPQQPTVTSVPPTSTPPPPTATSVPPSPTPTTVPEPRIVFEAIWEDGLDGWDINGDWGIVDRFLQRTAAQGMATIVAPHRPSGEYTIEAIMEPLGDDLSAAVLGFVIQSGDSGQPRVIAAPASSPGTPIYRLEVSESGTRFLVDDVVVSDIPSDGLLSPDGVGLFVAGAGARVYWFIVIE